jgi:hypothetical protein
MSSTFRLEHSFPDISVELFERHFNHPELIHMLSRMPAFRSRDLVERTELGGGAINWRFKVVAGGDVPGQSPHRRHADVARGHTLRAQGPHDLLDHHTAQPPGA